MNEPVIMCRRCGHGYRDIRQAVFGVVNGQVKPQCEDTGSCDFRVFCRILFGAGTTLFIRTERKEFGMRDYTGRVFDRYSEPTK